MSGFVRSTAGSTATHKRRTIRGVLSGTVAAGDVVQIDSSVSPDAAKMRTFKKAAAGVATGNPLCAGVAAELGVSGQTIDIHVEGYVEDVNSVGLVQDNYAVVDATAGRLEVYAKADHDVPFAIAMGTTAANLTDVILLNPLRL